MATLVISCDNKNETLQVADSSVGGWEGEYVGEYDGTAVATTEGAAVGAQEGGGVEVTNAVGVTVGAAVGNADGTAVGTTKASEGKENVTTTPSVPTITNSFDALRYTIEL